MSIIQNSDSPWDRSGAQSESLALNLETLNAMQNSNPEPRTQNLEPQHMEDCMDKWECPCGYIYDPEEGDAENNIPVGTPFEELPDDWVCPLCGAEKEYFEKVE